MVNWSGLTEEVSREKYFYFLKYLIFYKGYDSFHFDITDNLLPGGELQTLTVMVKDPTEKKVCWSFSSAVILLRAPCAGHSPGKAILRGGERGRGSQVYFLHGNLGHLAVSLAGASPGPVSGEARSHSGH